MSDFYDEMYEAWRHGNNPDEMSQDEWDRLESLGFDPTYEDFYPEPTPEDIEELSKERDQ